ncbi:MAG TPA: hypothetical protein VF658_04870 [Pyrinomonadaceae bacterium]
MSDAKTPAAGGLPSWPDLIASELEPSDQSLQSQIKVAPERIKSAPRDSLIASNFGGFAEVLARAAILRGSEACLPAIKAIRPFLPKAIKEIESRLDARRAALAVHVLSYVNTVQCCGGKLPAEAKEVENRLPPRLARKADELYESRQRTMAFACLALGKTSLIDTFIVSNRPQTIEPGKTFGPNMPALIGYLAVALEQQAGPEVIEAAWLNFLEEYPMEQATETLSWSDLMWCARAVLVQFKRQPLETVADTLHQLVTR